MSALTTRAGLIQLSNSGLAADSVTEAEAITMSGADLTYRALASAADSAEGTWTKSAPSLLITIVEEYTGTAIYPADGPSVERAFVQIQSQHGNAGSTYLPDITEAAELTGFSGADLTQAALRDAAEYNAVGFVPATADKTNTAAEYFQEIYGVA